MSLPAKIMHVGPTGNWWLLHDRSSSSAKTQPRIYTYADFVATVRDQIDRQMRRTDKDSRVFNGGYTVDGDVQWLLHDHQFPARLGGGGGGAGDEPYYPLLTFHATSDVAKVRSIAKHGYLAPGEVHATHGYTLKMKNGQYHGEGVYTSTHFDTAQWYTFVDRHGSVQLIVNWVLLGTTHYVNDDPPAYTTCSRSGYNGGAGAMWSKQTVYGNEAYDRGIRYTVNGTYGNGAHTRLLHDLSVVVSGDSARVVPLAVVTLRPNWQCTHMQTYLRTAVGGGGGGASAVGMVGTLHSLERPFALERDAVVTLYRMCADWHIVDPPAALAPLPRAQTTTTTTASNMDVQAATYVRHHVLVPMRLCTSDVGDATAHYTLTQLKSFYGALRGDEKRVVFHGNGDAVHVHRADGADQFESFARAHAVGARLGERPDDDDDANARANAAGTTLAALRATLETVTEELREPSPMEIVYVLLLDHALDVRADGGVQALCAAYEPLLRVRRLMVKLIFVGCEPHMALVGGLKYRLQTVEHHEALVHVVRDNGGDGGNAQSESNTADGGDTGWDDVVDAILEENAALAVCSRVRYVVPFPYGVVGEGFVDDLVHNPVWGGEQQSFERHVLYKGAEPLPAMGIDGRHYAVEYVSRDDVVAALRGDADASYARARRRDEADLVRRRAERVQAARQYARMLALFCDGVVALMCRFRTFVVRSASRVQQYHGAVAMLCQALVRELDSVAAMADGGGGGGGGDGGGDKDDPNGDGARALFASMCDAPRLRRACHQVQVLVSDMNAMASVRFGGVWFDRLVRMRFAKSIVRRVDGAFAAQPEQASALGSALRGYRIKTRRTSASEIEPWLIVVDVVSNECASASLDDNKADDVLPHRFPRDDVERMYWAHVFTRNPHLFMHAQPYALLTVAWVRSLELFFRSERDTSTTTTTTTTAAADWDRCWSLAERVRAAAAHDAEMRTVLEAVGGAAADALAEHLTEACDVQSMCRLLGAMLCDGARAHVSFRVGDGKYAALAFAMMAECVMRGCRAHLRTTATTTTTTTEGDARARAVNDVLRRTLGLVPPRAHQRQQAYATRAEAVAACARRTSRFYRQRYTNCSPFALVAALGFLERWHAGADKHDVLAAFVSGDISMRRFLRDHLPGRDGAETQLALFVQGVRFHRARHRHGLQFSDPAAIVAQAEAEQRALMAHEERVRDERNGRRAARVHQRMLQAQPFQTYHQRVKLFTPADVERFNAQCERRDEWAELVAERGGLLRHHCCYVDCPQYLHCFATATDRAPRSRTRHGIMRHLRHNHLVHAYVPAFHAVARRCAHGATYDEFVRAMDDRFARVRAYRSLHNKEQYLRDAWAFYKAAPAATR